MEKEKKKRKGLRYLTVNGTQWSYIVGRSTIAIYDPEDKRYFPRFSDIHKYNGEGNLNPAEILNYILTEILGDNPIHQRCTRCHTVKADVYLRCNPYEVEIHDNDEKHYFCNDCVASLAEEI